MCVCSFVRRYVLVKINRLARFTHAAEVDQLCVVKRKKKKKKRRREEKVVKQIGEFVHIVRLLKTEGFSSMKSNDLYESASELKSWRNLRLKQLPPLKDEIGEKGVYVNSPSLPRCSFKMM